MKQLRRITALSLVWTLFLSINVQAFEETSDLYYEGSGIEVTFKNYLGVIEDATYIQHRMGTNEEILAWMNIMSFSADGNYITITNKDYDLLVFDGVHVYSYYDGETGVYHTEMDGLPFRQATSVEKGESLNLAIDDLATNIPPIMVDLYLYHDPGEDPERTSIPMDESDEPIANGYIFLLVVPEDFDLTSEALAEIGIITTDITLADGTQLTPPAAEETPEEADDSAGSPQAPLEADVTLLLNGVAQSLSDPILNLNGRALYPFRECLTLLGAEIDWDKALSKASGRLEDITVSFTVGSGTYEINGEPFEMEAGVAVFIHNNKTYIPLRYAAEALGFTVEWQTEQNAINISK